MDTNGHAFRPHSDTYLSNIKLVDSRLPGLVKLFDDFYRDKRTAFVFTADHGMNSRGAHGDGDLENTETPIISWGAGVAGPETTKARRVLLDEAAWNLGNFGRHDVEQGDVALLMSTLIGVSPPMNAVGKLPIDFLDHRLDSQFLAHAALANAKQAYAQFLVKESEKQRTEPWFKPFPGFASNGDSRLERAASLANTGAFEESRQLSFEVIDLSIQGSRYYQTYDWLFLRAVVSSGYVGWIVFSLLWTVATYSGFQLSRSASSSQWDTIIDVVAFITGLSLVALLVYKQSPLMYYIYVAFPICFWSESAKHAPTVWTSIAGSWKISDLGLTVAGLFVYTGGLELLTFSYFDRRVLAACFVALSLGYLAILPSRARAKHFVLAVSWALSCLVAASFMLLPVDLPENLTLM